MVTTAFPGPDAVVSARVVIRAASIPWRVVR
jgi:hypothetical protein